MALAPNCERVVAALAREYPHEFDDCHRPERGARAWAFIRRVAWVLHSTVDQRFGLNGKRGNVNDPSMDAVSFRNPASAAGGVEIIDVVASAGETDPNRPQPSPAWIDQTQATINKREIGAYIQPEPVSGGTPKPPVVDTPPPAPAPAPVCQCQCAYESADVAGVYEVLTKLVALVEQQGMRREELELTAVKDRDDIKVRIERVSQELANKPDGGKCRLRW